MTPVCRPNPCKPPKSSSGSIAHASMEETALTHALSSAGKACIWPVHQPDIVDQDCKGHPKMTQCHLRKQTESVEAALRKLLEHALIPMHGLQILSSILGRLAEAWCENGNWPSCWLVIGCQPQDMHKKDDCRDSCNSSVTGSDDLPSSRTAYHGWRRHLMWRKAAGGIYTFCSYCLLRSGM